MGRRSNSSARAQGGHEVVGAMSAEHDGGLLGQERLQGFQLHVRRRRFLGGGLFLAVSLRLGKSGADEVGGAHARAR